jgi:hypothetical protein
VGLGIQHVKRRVRFSSVVCSAPLYSSTLSHKLHDFRETVIEYKIRVLIFSTNFSETFIILRIIKLDTIINVCRSSCQVVVILVRFK